MVRHEALKPLSRQHHNGLALVVMARRGIEQRGERAVASWCERAVERYDTELVHHFEAEEKILFPAVRAAVGELPLVDELIAEHRKLEQLAAKMRLRASGDLLEEFLELLRSHIRREENELFEMAQEKLPAEQLEALGEPLAARTVAICLTVEDKEES